MENNAIHKEHFELICHLVEAVSGSSVIRANEAMRESMGEWGRAMVGETFLQIREKSKNSNILEIMSDDADLNQELLGAYAYQIRQIATAKSEKDSGTPENSEESA